MEKSRKTHQYEEEGTRGGGGSKITNLYTTSPAISNKLIQNSSSQNLQNYTSSQTIFNKSGEFTKGF